MMTDQPTDAFQEAANAALDIAFNGDAEEVETDLANLFAFHANQRQAAIVAWLRKPEMPSDCAYLADMIEDGEWKGQG
jgi:hypothetical protein